MSIEKTEDRGDVVKDENEVTQGDQTGETVDQTDEQTQDAASTDVETQTDAEDAGSKDEPKIPKSRFDQAVGKARKAQEMAERKAQELEEQIKASKGKVDASKIEEEIDALEEDLEAARADGDKARAKQIRTEIRRRDQMLADARAEVKMNYATAVAIEQIRYDAAVAAMEAEHPELNEDSDEYDEDLAGEVIEFKTAFEKSGLSSTEALKKSLKAIYRGGPKPAAEKADEAGKKASDRKADAVTRGLATKKNQPNTTVKGGENSDRAGKLGTAKDVSKMSDKDFDKLSKEDLARLRGDHVS